MTVTVNPVNDDPEANDDTATTPYNTAVTIPVLDNDTDVDGDPLDVIGASSPNGDVTINPDGTITFEPTPGFEGTATITYEVSDGNGGTDTAEVKVTVEENPLDGIVEGTSGDDLIDLGYTGDPPKGGTWSTITTRSCRAKVRMTISSKLRGRRHRLCRRRQRRDRRRRR